MTDSTTPGLRPALALLMLCGLTVAGLQVDAANGSFVALLEVGVATLYWAAGLLVAVRRPTFGIGWLLLGAGASLYVAGFTLFTARAFIAVGMVLGATVFGFVIHLLHGLPTGRLPTGASRRTVIAAYAIVVVGFADTYLFPPGPSSPDTFLRLTDRRLVRDAWHATGSTLFTAATLVTAVLLVRRLRGMPAEQARLLAPVYAYGVVAMIAVVLIPNGIDSLFGLTADTVSTGQLIALAGVPIAFVAVILRGAFEPAAGVFGLSRRLEPIAGDLALVQAEVARTLGDQSARLAVWAAEAFVDADGAILQPGAGRRAAVEVTRAGARVGAIDYDPEQQPDRALVEAAGDIVALQLERERLTAELRLSRERVVEAGDRERRRLARDLHDGLQNRLVMLAIRARRNGAAPAGEPSLPEDIDTAIDELREFVQGVMPSGLLERGLGAAIDDLADRTPVPTHVDLQEGSMPAVVESTLYFLVAEALTNAVKHAGASRIDVRLRHGDRSVTVTVTDDGCGGASAGATRDRVETLGGTLAVDSPLGGGTRIVAEVPCAS